MVLGTHVCVIFLRAAMKMANIDSVFDFMFTSSTKDKVSILWLLLVFKIVMNYVLCKKSNKL